MNIGYLTEPVQEYVKAVDAAETFEQLYHVVGLYKRVASDAVAVLDGMDAKGFKRWREGLALERKKKFAGEDFAREFGAILIPEVMMVVALTAQQFHAPWGCAFIRMKEEGQIVEKNGIAKMADKPKPLTAQEKANEDIFDRR